VEAVPVRGKVRGPLRPPVQVRMQAAVRKPVPLPGWVAVLPGSQESAPGPCRRSPELDQAGGYGGVGVDDDAAVLVPDSKTCVAVGRSEPRRRPWRRRPKVRSGGAGSSSHARSGAAARVRQRYPADRCRRQQGEVALRHDRRSRSIRRRPPRRQLGRSRSSLPVGDRGGQRDVAAAWTSSPGVAPPVRALRISPRPGVAASPPRRIPRPAGQPGAGARRPPGSSADRPPPPRALPLPTCHRWPVAVGPAPARVSTHSASMRVPSFE
jgi:hypothetical protein